MKKIVITGATSMIGIALIDICIKNNVKVLAIIRKNTVRSNRIPKSELIYTIECDLDKLDTFSATSESYDVFYHLAWAYTSKAYREDPVFQAENIRFTLDAVNLAKKLGCKKFIGAGSQAEYGEVEGLISANTRPAPVTSYGIAKYSANMLSQKLCENFGMVHIWGRIFSVYGCNDNDDTMLNYAIDQFIKEKEANFSSAVQMWNYLNERDAGMIFYLLGKKEVKSGTYCIADKESRPLREYIIEMAEVFGEKAKCKFAPIRPDIKVAGLQADIGKTIDAIDYLPQVKFKEGISQVIADKRAKRN